MAIIFKRFLSSSEHHQQQYGEIGKKARDLFSCGYYYGVLCLDMKTRPNDNVEITTSWAKCMEDNRLYGTVEAKYKMADYNLALTEKLNKNSFLNTELSYKNKLVNGLSLSFGGAFSPRTGLRTGLIKIEWCNRYCSANSDLEIGKNFSFITSSVVFGCHGVFGGFLWRYDIHNDRQTDLNFATGYSTDDFYLHTCVNNGNECGGSIYHKVAPELEVGVDMKWWTKGPEPLCGAAARYWFNNSTSVRGKINNISELGLSYEQKLTEGVTLTTSTILDLRNVVSGKHKFGLGLRLEL